MFKKHKIILIIGITLFFSSVIFVSVFFILYERDHAGRLPNEGWWHVTLHLNSEIEDKKPCASYANIEEKKIRFKLFKKGIFKFSTDDWSMQDEDGNIFQGDDEGSSAIYFNRGSESYCLFYTTGTTTGCLYFPNMNEYKNINNPGSCLTRYSGEALLE